MHQSVVCSDDCISFAFSCLFVEDWAERKATTNASRHDVNVQGRLRLIKACVHWAEKTIMELY